MKVKIAIIGCGMIAEESYLPGIAQMEKGELVAVCNRSAGRAELLKDMFNVPHSYTSLDTMLAEEEFDLLVNLTPIQPHYEINLKALQAGKHVFSEKTFRYPWGMNAANRTSRASSGTSAIPVKWLNFIVLAPETGPVTS